MTTPKPEKAWAVYQDGIRLLIWTIRINGESAIDIAERNLCTSWHTLQDLGYRCLPVVITPEKEG